MTKCYEKIYKFDKGKQLSVSNDKHGGTWESYELLITYTDGTRIGTVHSDYMRYNVTTYRGAIISQNLSGGDNSYFYGNVHDLSVELNKEGQFVITGNSDGAFTPPVIGRDNMTLTKYGKEVLSECFPSALEYHAPTNDSTDHSFDEENLGNEPYVDLAMNLEIL